MNNLSKKELTQFVGKVKKKRIAIIGDVMLDTFEYGKVTRMSPEAPVPVILINDIISMPGGAGNVALNIKHLGGEPVLITTVGNDAESITLKNIFKKEKMSVSGIFTEKVKPTITKKRVLVDGKHFARVDKESTDKSSKKVEVEIINFFKKNVSKFDCVILSDYVKGLMTKKIVDEICKISNQKNLPIIVDTKPKNAHLYKGKKLKVITPNLIEAREISGKEELHAVAKQLKAFFVSGILITRGEEGMSLFDQDLHTHLPARTTNVVDVSGCGDTVVSTLSLALGAKLPTVEAIKYANHAAGLVVQKPGTATLTMKEFINSRFK